MKLKWVKRILPVTLAFSMFISEAAVASMPVYAAEVSGQEVLSEEVPAEAA